MERVEINKKGQAQVLLRPAADAPKLTYLPMFISTNL